MVSFDIFEGSFQKHILNGISTEVNPPGITAQSVLSNKFEQSTDSLSLVCFERNEHRKTPSTPQSSNSGSLNFLYSKFCNTSVHLSFLWHCIKPTSNMFVDNFGRGLGFLHDQRFQFSLAHEDHGQTILTVCSPVLLTVQFLFQMLYFNSPNNSDLH